MTAATTPAPAYGPATGLAVAENANPAAAGQAAPYATHPKPSMKETPMTDQMTPALPTLADMTREERAACRWMQADVETWGDRVVIVVPNASGGRAVMLERWGGVAYQDHDSITPRPDLPRMTWPGDKKPAPAPSPEDYPPRDQLTLGAKWADIDKLEEALRRKGEAADQAIVLDDEGDAYVWETVGRGRWMFRVPVQQCGPFRLILNDQEADQ